MSRWSDEFKHHAIHELLENAEKQLATDPEDIDANTLDELRRIKKVIGNLRAVVSGLDAEFFPKQLLDQVTQHFQQHVLNELSAFVSNGNVGHLTNANNNATNYIPHIFQLSAMSRPMESQAIVAQAEESLATFVKKMEITAAETGDIAARQTDELASLNLKCEELTAELEALEASSKARLSEWSEEFTERQNERLEEHSKSQIARDSRFEELVSDWKETIERQRSSLEKIQKDELEQIAKNFKTIGDDVLTDVKAKHKEVKEIHKLVGRDSVAGGYQTSAGEENVAANLWRKISLGCLAAAVVWLTVKYFIGFAASDSGQYNWPEIITASSLTAILLVAAGYTSRQSRMHRDNERLLRSYALETKALDPFIASLPVTEQQAIKAELVRRMFGQQNTSSSKGTSQIDDTAINTIADRVIKTVKDFVPKE